MSANLLPSPMSDPIEFNNSIDLSDIGGTLTLAETTHDAWLPPEPVNTFEWLCENMHSHKGAPFNPVQFPWTKGICEAWDDPRTRNIWVKMGSRLGKTEVSLGCHACAQRHDPNTGMIGASTQRLLEKTIGDRFYGMMAKTPALADLCPPKHRQNSHKVSTRTFITYGAWSGSPTTLGDIDPKYVNLLEVSKWVREQKSESDSIELALARGSEIPDRKFLGESTPTIKGACRITKFVERASNEYFHVPCPHCNHHQRLRRNTTGERKDGGLMWDGGPEEAISPEKAYQTAHYVCESCHKNIDETQRRSMIQKGVWCGTGQRVDKNGELVGKPANGIRERSFNLSRMYGWTFTFADYARAYIESLSLSGQSFANDWEGEAWVPLKVEMEWEQLAKRLCVGDWELGQVPEGCYFLTCAVDVQVDHFVCATFGWDNRQRGCLIRHGTVDTWDQVREWIQRPYEALDGGSDMRARMTLIDSRDGNRKDEIINFCRSVNDEAGPHVYPSMGGNHGSMNLRFFRKLAIDADNEIGKKAKRNIVPGIHLIMINTTVFQEWMDNVMVNRVPGDDMSMMLPQCLIEDQDLFDQLLNEKLNKEKGIWEHIDTLVPNDMRDVFRYGRCAAEVLTNGNWARIPKHRPRQLPESEADRHQRQRRTAEQLNRNRESGGKPNQSKKRFVRRPSSTSSKRFVRRKSL
ncbi:terminase gpA endonuclease subunit [Aporhodopirellula aestuarii]|uniref:Phage terminase large subunit family protein n=1 Tax=Aporhodopirellula aestuarii TaxID=2950107 RepID=A0ABT0U2C5_9BACT|nr:terminase gpA endonuclease subunit [Aporhodopirellula aestuarii]MCM2370956.1 phage terminase large subunit family protein [Aporhodopirellula aestuarii]